MIRVRTDRVALLAVVALFCLASVSAIDPPSSKPSSKPKQSIGKYATLFLKPSKSEVDVDAYAFVIPVRPLKEPTWLFSIASLHRTTKLLLQRHDSGICGNQKLLYLVP